MEDKVKQFRQISEFVSKKNNAVKPVHDDNYFREQALDSVRKRNANYCSFMDEYVANYGEKAKSAKCMKKIFFGAIMVLLFGMVTACMMAFWNISKKPNMSYSDVAAIITAVGGIIGSFIVLPKVVAENLFPSKEEDRTAEIFDSMIKYDLELEKFHIKQEQPEKGHSIIQTDKGRGNSHP